VQVIVGKQLSVACSVLLCKNAVDRFLIGVDGVVASDRCVCMGGVGWGGVEGGARGALPLNMSQPASSRLITNPEPAH